MAVKLVNKKKVGKDGKAGIEGLKVEIAVQKYIKHPQLVGLYDYFVDAKYHYLVMEHIDGGEVGGEAGACEVLAFFVLQLTRPDVAFAGWLAGWLATLATTYSSSTGCSTSECTARRTRGQV